jgi:hypothetical protein
MSRNWVWHYNTWFLSPPIAVCNITPLLPIRLQSWRYFLSVSSFDLIQNWVDQDHAHECRFLFPSEGSIAQMRYTRSGVFEAPERAINLSNRNGVVVENSRTGRGQTQQVQQLSSSRIVDVWLIGSIVSFNFWGFSYLGLPHPLATGRFSATQSRIVGISFPDDS